MRTTDPSRLMVIQTKMAIVVMTTSICFECALIIYFPIIFICSLFWSPSISFFLRFSFRFLECETPYTIIEIGVYMGLQAHTVITSFLSLNNTHFICFGFVYCRSFLLLFITIIVVLLGK